MVMMDVVLKKCFWFVLVRRVLLVNVYVCWIVVWVMVNGSSFGSLLWGIVSIKFLIFDVFIVFVCGFVGLIIVWVGLEVFRSIRIWKVSGLIWR